MLVWALALAVSATLLSYARPWQTDTLFIHGADYRREMFAWVLSGVGAESTPSQFIPQHVMHALAVSALALASGGLLAMPMGAILMNYMGHYVGALAAASAHPGLTMLLGWHPVGRHPHRELRGDRRRAVGAAPRPAVRVPH